MRISNSKALIRGAVVFCLFFGSARLALAEEYAHFPGSTMYVGGNFDARALNRAYLPCIDNDGPKVLTRYGPDGGVSGPSNISIDQLSSKREFFDYLSISGSIGGHYKFFSGGASSSFERQSSELDSSFSWAFRAHTTFADVGMLNPRLNREASRLVAAGDLNGFRARCGTDFVGVETRAAMVAVIYTVRDLKRSDQQRLKAKFNAEVQGGVFDGNAQASYERFVREATSVGSLSFQMYVLGGRGIQELGDVVLASGNIDEIKGIIQRTMQQMSIDNSYPVKFTTGSLSSFVPSLASYEFGRYNQLLESAYFGTLTLEEKLERLRTVLANQEDFELTPVQLAYLTDKFNEVQAALDYIRLKVESCQSLHTGPISQITNRVTTTRFAQDCRLDPTKAFINVTIPDPQPFTVEWRLDPLSGSPKTFLYVTVSGRGLSEVKIRRADGSIDSVPRITTEADDMKKAIAAIDMGINPTLSNYTIEVKTVAGNTYTKELQLDPRAPSSVKIIDTLSPAGRLSVRGDSASPLAVNPSPSRFRLFPLDSRARAAIEP